MAKKPDGAAAGVQRVSFTKSAADRIARVVRDFEGGDRDQGPMEFGMRGAAQSQRVFRVATFTGSWSIEGRKTVTLIHVTSTPNTTSVLNLFADITAANGSRYCAIAKDGGAWYLVAAQC